MRVVAVLVIAALAACGGAPRRQNLWPDAPLQLRDDSDREQATDSLWVLPFGPQRDAVRARIASAIAVRLSDALAEDRPYVAEALLYQLAELWQLDPQNIGTGLADNIDTL